MNGHIIATMVALIIFLLATIWFARKKYKINLSDCIFCIGAGLGEDCSYAGSSPSKGWNHCFNE